MQTPLENLDVGSFLLFEYSSQSSGSLSSVVGTIELNPNTIDSGRQLIALGPSDGTSKANPLLINNDKSTLCVEIILNQRNRMIDYKHIYCV